MKTLFTRATAFCGKNYNKILLVLVQLFLTAVSFSQQTTVLPGDGSYSQTSSPQGGLRYQRGFYLITPKEVKANGLVNGNSINSVGFTLGVAQKDTTKGAFKVYLQNTTDTVSRVDTGWTNVTTSTASLAILKGLFPGNYEWQVRSLCNTNSAYSTVTTFSNANVSACGQPTNLATSAITAISATFSWNAPSSTVSKYYVEYKSLDTTGWTRDSTTNTSYNATSLIQNKNYQCRVRTACASSSSDFISTSFITNPSVSCSAPTVLTVGSIANSSAILRWTAAAGATYYSIQYRRVGTANWSTTISFADTVIVKANIVPGTTYEWQVRTVCSAGTGAYIAGSNFTTTGTTVCYSPINLTTNSITDSSATLKWTAVTGATSYEVRYRLKETISWANAITPTTAMSLVHNDSLVIPKTAGPYNVKFVNGSAFTYSGNGIYVAWEYSQSGASITTNNTSISTIANTSVKGVNGVDSVKYLLSFTGRSDTNTTALQSRLVSTNVRPETRLGSSALADSVAVLNVYALGSTAVSFTVDSISALVQNSTSSSKTYSVTLTVKDAKTSSIKYSKSQNITISGNTKQAVLFTGWTPSALGVDSIIVSVPPQAGENVTNNNSNSYVQNVVNSFVFYADGAKNVGQAGFDTLSGLLLNRYHVAACAKINSAQVYLTSSAIGHAVYAVALNAAHTIVAQSSSFTPDSTQVNAYHTFYFSNAPQMKATDFYVGLAQQSSYVGYSPVGVQWEGSDIRSNAYFRAALDGSNLTDQPAPGRLMIGAELIPGTAVPAITGNLIICSSGNSTTLTAGSTVTRFADSVISYSSQGSANAFAANKALGTPDVYPNSALSSNAWTTATQDGGREFIVLHFPNAAPVNFIDIYETLNPGAVDTVYVKDPSAGYVQVYAGSATASSQTARRNRITFPLTAYNVSEVRIALNSAAVSGFNTIDAVGIGKLTTPATFSSYLWTGGEATQTKVVSAAGVYKLTTTDANGCQASDSVTVTTPVQIVPTISASRPTTFCTGDSTILKSSQTGGNTWSTGAKTDSISVKIAGNYTVSYNSGNSCGSGTSTATVVTVNALPAISVTPHTTSICPSGSATFDAGAGFNNYAWSNGANTQTTTVSAIGSYNVKVTDANGCKASDTVTVTASPALTPSITGTLSFCPGGNTVLDAGAGYSSYVWSTGATTRTITVTTAGTFSVTVKNSTGCSGSANVTTTLLAPPTPAITGTLTFCPGGSTTLDAGAGYSSYKWSTGETSQTINVSSAANYSVTVTNSSGCSGATNVTTSLFAVAPLAITGSTGFCPGGSTTLTANSGFSSYSWSTGAITQNITVNAANTYTLTVTDANSCSTNKSVTVVQNAAPNPSIAGTLSFCGGNTSTLDAGAGYSAYLWSTGATTQAIAVTTVGTFKVTVTDNNGCTGSDSVTTTTQSALPATPGAISGNAYSVCNSTQTYTISPVSNAERYVWTVPDGATIVSGQGSTTISVNFGSAFSSGDITVAAANTCGQSSSLYPRTLTVTIAPAAPGTIAGQATGVCGPTTKSFSISSVPSASYYTWTVPAGASILSGQNSTNITVSFSSSYTSGTICVKSNNSCGFSSGTSCLTVAGIPTTPGAISGIVSVCSKQKNVTYSVQPVAGATSYTWTVPSQATITSGQGTNSIVVAFGTKTGSITVKATGTCGTSATRSLAINMNCTGVRVNNDYVPEQQQSLPITKVSVFPNPSSGIFNLKLPADQDGQQLHTSIFDAQGKKVLAREIKSTRENIILDLTNQPHGLYLVQILTDGEKREVLKIMVQ